MSRLFFGHLQNSLSKVLATEQPKQTFNGVVKPYRLREACFQGSLVNPLLNLLLVFTRIFLSKILDDEALHLESFLEENLEVLDSIFFLKRFVIIRYHAAHDYRPLAHGYKYGRDLLHLPMRPHNFSEASAASR